MAVSERRAVPRASTKELLVRVEGFCLHKFGYASDISSCGMRLRTFTNCAPHSFDENKLMRVGFILPGREIEISCEAEPVWHERPVGDSISTMMQGVRFKNLEPSAQVEIYDWVVNHMK